MINFIHLDIKIQSILSSVDQCCSLFVGTLKICYVQVDGFQFQTVLREALNNAIIHGAHGDQKLLIDVTLRINQDILELIVSDPGLGFNWREALEIIKTTEFLIEKPSGRGLYMMKNFSDELRYNKQGNILTIKKKIVTAQFELKEQDNE